MNKKDKYVITYQETGESEDLIDQYANFIYKYFNLFTKSSPDLSNRDIRYFLSCYIDSKEQREILRSGRYRQKETIFFAYKVIAKLRRKFSKHTKKEIYNELLIPFLECATEYQDTGDSFSVYLYTTYKYKLVEHLRNVKPDIISRNETIFQEIKEQEVWESRIKNHLEIMKDTEYFTFMKEWIHGNESKAPFDAMKPHERYILIKYYLEKKNDKEIARLLPYSPKSIQRIRKRLTQNLINQYNQGELQCLQML